MVLRNSGLNFHTFILRVTDHFWQLHHFYRLYNSSYSKARQIRIVLLASCSYLFIAAFSRKQYSNSNKPVGQKRNPNHIMSLHTKITSSFTMHYKMLVIILGRVRKRKMNFRETGSSEWDIYAFKSCAFFWWGCTTY